MNKLNVSLPKDAGNGYWYTPKSEDVGNVVSTPGKYYQTGRRLAADTLEPNVRYTSYREKAIPSRYAFDLYVDTTDDSVSVLQPTKDGTILQELKNMDDVQTKNTTVRHDHGDEFKLFERQAKDGSYSITRLKNGEVVGGYEVKPLDRKFATGRFKAKLEKLALKIGTDANGYERPVLRRVGGFLFDIAKKIK